MSNIPSKNTLILPKKIHPLFHLMHPKNPTFCSNTPKKRGYLRCDSRGIYVPGNIPLAQVGPTIFLFFVHDKIHGICQLSKRRSQWEKRVLSMCSQSTTLSNTQHKWMNSKGEIKKSKSSFGASSPTCARGIIWEPTYLGPCDFLLFAFKNLLVVFPHEFSTHQKHVSPYVNFSF